MTISVTFYHKTNIIGKINMASLFICLLHAFLCAQASVGNCIVALQSYNQFEDMLARNATVDPVRMAQQYAVSFKKQLKNVDRETYTESSAPIPVRITARPVSGGAVPASNAEEQSVTLATFKSLMDELNMQIKDINAIANKVGFAVLLVIHVMMLLPSSN